MIICVLGLYFPSVHKNGICFILQDWLNYSMCCFQLLENLKTKTKNVLKNCWAISRIKLVLGHTQEANFVFVYSYKLTKCFDYVKDLSETSPIESIDRTVGQIVCAV